MLRRLFAVPLVLATLAACGGGGDGPTGPAAITTITISAPPQALSAIGETVTLTAVGKSAKGATIDGVSYTWTTSNPGVATVSNGQVTAVSNGSTTITAAAGSATGTVQVTVQQSASQVAVTFASDTIRAIGDTVRATGTARDSRGNAIPGATVTWTSVNPAVVSVDANGLMTAIAEGSSVVRGSSGTAQGERTVQVRQRASQLVFIRQPSNGRAGIALVTQPQAELRDARGNRVSTDNSTVVTATVGTGGGTVVSGATATANTGVVTFTNLAIGGSVGLKVLQLQAPNTSVASSNAITLSAGDPATVITASGNGQNGLAGTALPVQLTAGVRDAFGNPVPDVPVNFVVTQGTGTVNPAQGQTNASGNVSTTHTLSRYAGASTVTAQSAAVPAAQVQFTATGAPNGVIRGTITGSGAPIITASTVSSVRAGTPKRRLVGMPTNLPKSMFATQKNYGQATPTSQSTARPAPPEQFVPGEWLVSYRPEGIGAPAMSTQYRQTSTITQVRSAIMSAISSEVSSGELNVESVSPVTLTARVKVDPTANETQVVEKLRRDKRVLAVERNYLQHSHRRVLTAMEKMLAQRGVGSAAPLGSLNDFMLEPYSFASMLNTFPGGGIYPGNARYAQQSWHYNMVRLPLAWTVITSSQNILVAVVDDGIRFDHPSMQGVLTNDGYDFVSLRNAALCAGGSVNVTGDGNGYDSDPTNPMDRDPGNNCMGGPSLNGNHGLHVAATIGAVRNNASGVVGVSWQSRIRPVRVMGMDGSGTTYDIVQGTLYAAGLPADNGLGGTVTAAGGAARIINMSLGGGSPSVIQANAVQAAFINGSLIIASSGNNNNANPNYPASYPEPVSVAAVGPQMVRASYSSYSPQVDVAAPGGETSQGLSHGVMSATWNYQTNTASVDQWDGTSMATPHVTGMAALLLAREPSLTAAQLKARIINHTIDLQSPGYDQFTGWGLVNMVNMLTASTTAQRTLYVRLVRASTGETVQIVPAGVGGTFGFTGLSDGAYWVFAGTDEFGDGLFGLPMRPWGAMGGASIPTNVVVDGAGLYAANFALTMATEVEPNNTPENADELLPDGFNTGTTSNAQDVDFFRLRIRVPGTYAVEVTGHVGACGFSLETDPILTLFTASGTQLDTNDDIDVNNVDFCSRVTGNLPVGDYLVRVTGYGAGRYVVHARKQP